MCTFGHLCCLICQHDLRLPTASAVADVSYRRLEDVVCVNIGVFMYHWLPGCVYIAVDTEQPSSPYHYHDTFVEYLKGAEAIWT